MVCVAVPRRRSEGTYPSGNAGGRRVVPVASSRLAIARCRKRERKLLRQITRAVQRGAPIEARGLADLYMMSNAAMVVAIIEAEMKRNLERKQLRRSRSSSTGRQALTRQEVLDLAAKTSPYLGCGESATVRYLPKPAGGIRVQIGGVGWQVPPPLESC